ncbi:hypothetical protein A1O3_08301 [Capronia epimyces CBS 606.96]|uniref:MICOS complex subunit MIC12 n=1 Tax=Capronia epimyces CBS 606.96 TaxID=1182542 RepID=W9XRQ5_9EURO|nr:uncharacterized protein A1O3_08301 [Capronia epimyces CBS 606.96]EXJ80015.1 hypothetical protein A1O3_08301 [Capronia epimyces CBS 606.96]
MGFTTGFLGGVTLTYSLLYFSLYVHRANRSVQRSLLSQQATLLNSVVEPLPPLPDPPAYEVRRAGLVEELKDRWNSEIERLVRNFQETDWTEKRARLEEQAAVVWTNVKSSESAHELESKAKQLEQKVKDTITDGTGNVKDAVARKAEKVVAGAEDKVKDQVEREPRLLELK